MLRGVGEQYDVIIDVIRWHPDGGGFIIKKMVFGFLPRLQQVVGEFETRSFLGEVAEGSENGVQTRCDLIEILEKRQFRFQVFSVSGGRKL